MNTPSTSIPADPPAADASWSLVKRFGFRYLCCHWLLYAFPQPLSNLLGTFSGLWGRWSGGETPAGIAKVFGWMGKPEQWWQGLTTWLSDTGLKDVGLEVVHQRTGSGDTAHDYVKLGCIMVFSVMLAGLWSLLDRRDRGHPRLGRWLHLGARWWLAFILLGYGASKMYGGQFTEPGIWGMTREIGDKSPMGMVWTFMGSSEPYKFFGGFGEFLACLLLFHRRTALLGCMVATAVMTNIVALNWLYDVPVKLFSTNLLLCSVFLMAPWRKQLCGLLLSNRATQAVDISVFKRAWLRWTLTIFGLIWVGGALVSSHLGNMDRIEQRETAWLSKPQLYGLWKVEKMLLDGVEVPSSDSSRWEFFAIDRNKRAFVRTLLGNMISFTIEEDLEAGIVTVKTSGPEGAAEDWTVERGTKVLKIPHPNPRLMKEYGAQIDGERNTIVFSGKWNEKVLELHTVQKVFRLQRGLNLVQEIPFNR